MPVIPDDQKIWQHRLQAGGFRKTAIGFLRDRLRQEDRKAHLDRLIRRLGKYEPQLEIVNLLTDNPFWGQRLTQLVAARAEVTADPEIQFIFQGEGNIPNIPTRGENRLYLGCGDNFYALDSETGEVLWHRRNHGKTWSTAWLEEDCLYVSSGGRLQALSPADGGEGWAFVVNKTLTSPFAHQGKVFVGSEEGTLYAVDALGGRRLWTFNVAQPISVAPGVWQNKIFAVSKDQSLYAISRDEGECLWRFPTAGKIYAVPQVADGVIYLTSADHKVYALRAGTGLRLWSFTTGGEVQTSPFESDGRVYVGSRDRQFYVLDAEDGRELWHRKMFGYPSAATATRGMVYFSAQGRVYGFSVADHRLRWCFPLGAAMATTPVIGPGRLYVGTLKGRLIGLKLTSQLSESGAAQVLKEFLNSAPVTRLD